MPVCYACGEDHPLNYCLETLIKAKLKITQDVCNSAPFKLFLKVPIIVTNENDSFFNMPDEPGGETTTNEKKYYYKFLCCKLKSLLMIPEHYLPCLLNLERINE